MASATSVTNQPKSSVELQAKRFSYLGAKWSSLSQALYNTYDSALSSRTVLDQNLTIWNNFYEMRRGVRNWPWPNASNVITPIIPTQIDTLLANIVLATYAVQRFYVVNGNTPQAAQSQHDVEQYLNAELFRPRRGKSWLMQHVESLFAGLRDGNGITAISYRQEFKRARVAIVQRIQDPDTGMDIMDPETGEPHVNTSVEEQTIPVYDDVDLETIELRNFGVVPAWQTDIDKAAAVWCRRYIDSTELYAMCKSESNPEGPLDRKAVDFALSMTTPGQDELTLSRQGYSTYTIAGQIDVAQGEGGIAEWGLEQHIGPIEIIQINSNQFFGTQDDYVYWLHPQSETCLGFQKYQYWHNQRPYSVKTPLPRIDRFYGLSFVERMMPTVVEIHGNRNRRNDFLDQRTTPPMYELDGAKLLTKNNAWGPDARWKLPSKDAVGFIPLPDDVHYLLAGAQEEDRMRKDIEEFTGNSAPMLGAQSSGRPTAKGIQAQVARAGLRHNFIAMNVRDADQRTLNQIVQLKIQFGPNMNVTDTSQSGTPQRLMIPKEVLAQDYTWSIAGSGGPLDQATRTQEMQSLYALLMQNPLIQPHPVRVWGVTRMLLETYSRADVLALIGTRDEAESAEQQQAKQQQLAGMLQGIGIQPGGGAAPGGSQPHPGGHPHPAAPHMGAG